MNTEEPIAVTRERDGRVVVLRYNRPQAQNKSDYRMKERMADVYEELASDENVRVLVLTGTGAYFAAGGQVNAADPQERERFEAAHTRLLRAQSQLRLPVIVAANGDVLGGAVGELLAADFAIAVEGARFGFTQARRGAFPISSMGIVMPYLPQKFALEAFFSGRLYPVERALEMGLINRVVPREELWNATQEYVDMILALPPNVARIGRNGYFAMLSMPAGERLSYCEKLTAQMLREEATAKTSN